MVTAELPLQAPEGRASALDPSFSGDEQLQTAKSLLRQLVVRYMEQREITNGMQKLVDSLVPNTAKALHDAIRKHVGGQRHTLLASSTDPDSGAAQARFLYNSSLFRYNERNLKLLPLCTQLFERLRKTFIENVISLARCDWEEACVILATEHEVSTLKFLIESAPLINHFFNWVRRPWHSSAHVTYYA